MSRSRKDGRRGGGHWNTQGREYWSARGKRDRMAEPGRRAKRLTHRYERREARRIVREETNPPVARFTEPCAIGCVCFDCRERRYEQYADFAAWSLDREGEP